MTIDNLNPNQSTLEYEIDPKLDLVLEKIIDIKPELAWRCWTEPEYRPHGCGQNAACKCDLARTKRGHG